MSVDESTQELSAFHQAFAAELRALLERVPITHGMRMLDAACGDGFFVSGLEARVGHQGIVVGLDASATILRQMADPKCQKLVAGRLDQAPLAAGRFDGVLCCQSLFSLPEPVSSLAQLAEYVRPGGIVIVIENDSLHQLMLPWPPELELALRSAEYDSFRERSPQPQKFYVGRHLPGLFQEAGLESLGYFTDTIDRTAPLEPSAEEFLRLHLRGLQKRVAGHLSEQANRELRTMLQGDDGLSWFRVPTFTMTWLSVVAWARRT